MFIPRLNLYVLFIAMVFFFEQNIYWGWNIMPVSERELITDGFNLILLSLAWIMPKTQVIAKSPPKI
jgi:hypothetical protein